MKKLAAAPMVAVVISLAFVAPASAVTGPQVPYCSDGTSTRTGSFCTTTPDIPEQCLPYVQTYQTAYDTFINGRDYLHAGEPGRLRTRIVYWADRAHKDERGLHRQRTETTRLKREIRRLKHRLASQ